jgi:hypothetical protein
MRLWSKVKGIVEEKNTDRLLHCLVDYLFLFWLGFGMMLGIFYDTGECKFFCNFLQNFKSKNFINFSHAPKISQTSHNLFLHQPEISEKIKKNFNIFKYPIIASENLWRILQ